MTACGSTKLLIRPQTSCTQITVQDIDNLLILRYRALDIVVRSVHHASISAKKPALVFLKDRVLRVDERYSGARHPVAF